MSSNRVLMARPTYSFSQHLWFWAHGRSDSGALASFGRG